MRSVSCICGWWGSTSHQAQSLSGQSRDKRYENCPSKKEKERKGKKKKKNEMDMTLGETGGWQCWTEGGCGVVDGATNGRQFLGNGRLRYVGRSPLKKRGYLGTSAKAFHKLLEIFQNVSRNFSKRCPKNNQKWLFVSNESCSKVARKKQKLVLVWC